MKRWFPPALLTVLFVLFRVPPLLNAGLINADGAIAGLQARRMLEGEWQWHHWGRDYLISLDMTPTNPTEPPMHGQRPACPFTRRNVTGQ